MKDMTELKPSEFEQRVIEFLILQGWKVTKECIVGHKKKRRLL